jgi:hypothetical protein
MLEEAERGGCQAQGKLKKVKESPIPETKYKTKRLET